MGSTSDKSHLPTPPAESHHYPKSNITLEDRFIDEPRALRVAVIGGGLAGILAGILFPAKVPRIELVIYEKNSDLVSYSKANRTELSNRPREVLGSRMFIREFVVTFLPTCTSPLLLPTLNGRSNLLQALRFESTGKALRENTMYTTDVS